jgi:cytochrome d ubiquinol oxidase subunit I
MFSFFLESTFLGLFLYAEERLGSRLHWFTALCVFVGSWLSGFFIIATDAWMQHPVGYTTGLDGAIALSSLVSLLTNPWILWQYTHTMLAAVVTGSLVMSAVGAFYVLEQKSVAFGQTFIRIGVISAAIATLLLVFPTGDQQGKMIALNQPTTLAAMEGLFNAENGAPLALIGQPDTEHGRLDNAIVIPKMLSFLTYQRWEAEIKGLNDFPRDRWPDNVPLLYFSYHIMVGLGTLLIAVTALSAILLSLGRLYSNHAMLWALMLAFPFPYIATTAGWMTAEIGRQPWLIYGLMRTAEGTSARVSAGSGVFTLLGFLGLYALLGVLFLFLIWREIERGPEPSKSNVVPSVVTA